MEKIAKSLIVQGAAMKEIIVCAVNLTNAIFIVNSQKMMRKKENSFKAELQAFRQVTNLDLNDEKLINLAGELTKNLISPEITALNRKD